MPISKTKRQLIQVARRKLDLTDHDYRTLLWRVAWVESSTQLDDHGFDRAMDAFRQLGFVSDFAKENFGGVRRADMATVSQVRFIRDLWAECTDGEGTEAGFGKWLAKRYHVSSLRFLTKREATRVIGALQKWLERRQPKPHGAA